MSNRLNRRSHRRNRPLNNLRKLWNKKQDSDRWTIFRQSNHGHNTLAIDGVTIHLSMKAGGSVATRTADCRRDYARHWTPVHLDFEVEQVEQVAEQVVLAGGTMEELKTAELRLAAAQVDYLKSIAFIESLTGTILDKYGIKLDK